MADKRNSIARAKIEGDTLTVTFKTGEVLTLKASDIPDSISPQVKLYGAARLISTEYSKSETPVEAAKAMIEELTEGKWQPGRAAGTPKEEGPNEVVLAVAELKNVPVHLVQEKYNAMNRRDKGKLRQNPQIAVILARMAAEKAKEAAKNAKKSGTVDLGMDF